MPHAFYFKSTSRKWDALNFFNVVFIGAIILAGCFYFAFFAHGQITTPTPDCIFCEGRYQYHLQGIATDNRSIYWSFTTELVKTDMLGSLSVSTSVANHHGDITLKDGQVYATVNFGGWHSETPADNWCYVYDSTDFTFLTKYSTPEVIYGIGAIGYDGNIFMVGGGLQTEADDNIVYEYHGTDFNFITTHELHSDYIDGGIQTMAYGDGWWWYGCYGSELFMGDKYFQSVRSYAVSASTGWDRLTDGTYLRGYSAQTDGGWFGRVQYMDWNPPPTPAPSPILFLSETPTP